MTQDTGILDNLGDVDELLIEAGREYERRMANEPHYEHAGPKQGEFHEYDGPTGAIFGANRSGKSRTLAKIAVDLALGKHPTLSKRFPPPVKIRYVGVDFHRGVKLMILPNIYIHLPPEEIAAYPKEPSWQLEFKNKSFIELMACTQEIDKFLGVDRHAVFYDEEPRRDIFMENEMRIAQHEGITRVAMTPEMGMSWVYDELYLKAKDEPDIQYWVVTLDDNKFLKKGAKERIRKRFAGHEMERAKVHGEFVQLTGLVFKQFTEGLHVLAREPLNPLWIKSGCFSIDPHLSKPSAGLWCAVSPANELYLYDELAMDGLTFAGMTEAILKQEQRQGKALAPYYRLIDPTQAVQPTSMNTKRKYWEEFARLGMNFRVEHAYRDVMEGIGKIKQYLEPNEATGRPRLFVQEHLLQTIFEFQHMAWKQQKVVGGIQQAVDEVDSKKWDFIAALRWIALSEPKYRPEQLVRPPQRRKTSTAFGGRRVY